MIGFRIELLVVVTFGLQAGNRIGDSGVSSLVEGLKLNSSLQMLDLVSAFILLCLVSLFFEEFCDAWVAAKERNG